MIIPGLFDRQAALDIQHEVHTTRVNYRVLANTSKIGAIQLNGQGITLRIIGCGCGRFAIVIIQCIQYIFSVGISDFYSTDPDFVRL